MKNLKNILIKMIFKLFKLVLELIVERVLPTSNSDLHDSNADDADSDQGETHHTLDELPLPNITIQSAVTSSDGGEDDGEEPIIQD